MEDNFVLEKQQDFMEKDLESENIIDDIEKMVDDIEDTNINLIEKSNQEEGDQDDDADDADDANGFIALGLSIDVLSILKKLKFTIPTEIQKQAIPVAMSGKDVLGSADTGTGKTLAFCIPLVEKLLDDPSAKAMILAPTRELAMQIEKTLKDLLDIKPLREDRRDKKFSKFSKFGGNNRRSFEPKFTKSPLGIEMALIIGGEYIGNQFRALKNNPRVIIGTPGRVNDHIERQTLDLNQVSFVVLDETDRMLDMGFSEQIDLILRNVKKERQMLLFSATIPPKITGLVKSYMNNPISISTQTDGKNRIDLKSIKHDVVSVTENEKYNKLLEEVQSREGSIIIFVKTKFGADSLMDRLKDDDQYSEAIHGNLKHRERLKVIAGFRAQKFRIVIGTDIISRGIDIPDIAHVINFDLPDSPEDYVHRIGRTARAGAKGA
ncbi:MAG: DEAD/DEAH box helicase, partial [Anaplasmataceae bacterium]|nr:DEAD/DEAH box helicase [Anaplasmataceae bacterium]